MEEHIFTVPVIEAQKKFLSAAFQTVKHLFMDTENPMSQSLHDTVFSEADIEYLNALIDKCENSTDGDMWGFSIPEFLNFYKLVDLVIRVYESGYFEQMMKGFGELYNVPRYKGMSFSEFKDVVVALAKNVKEGYGSIEDIDTIEEYLWQIERAADPITGISPALAIFNHIPNLPKHVPQLLFSDYSEDHVVTYNLKVHPELITLNMLCVMIIVVIVTDIENPPAKVLNAYFPNMLEHVKALRDKFPKNNRRKYAKLSEIDLGVMYACNDLFGRLSASAHRNILPILDKRLIANKNNEIDFARNNTLMTFTTGHVDAHLAFINENFGHLDIIQDYKKVMQDFIGFDD